MSLLDRLLSPSDDPFREFAGTTPETARDYITQGVFRAQDAGHSDEEIEQALEWALGLFDESEADD